MSRADESLSEAARAEEADEVKLHVAEDVVRRERPSERRLAANEDDASAEEVELDDEEDIAVPRALPTLRVDAPGGTATAATSSRPPPSWTLPTG